MNPSNSAPAHDPSERPDTAPEAGEVAARVRARTSALEDLSHRPVAEHAAAYEALHDELQGVLAEIDGA